MYLTFWWFDLKDMDLEEPSMQAMFEEGENWKDVESGCVTVLLDDHHRLNAVMMLVKKEKMSWTTICTVGIQQCVNTGPV